jgi:hypothetical protein
MIIFPTHDLGGHKRSTVCPECHRAARIEVSCRDKRCELCHDDQLCVPCYVRDREGSPIPSEDDDQDDVFEDSD